MTTDDRDIGTITRAEAEQLVPETTRKHLDAEVKRTNELALARRQRTADQIADWR